MVARSASILAAAAVVVFGGSQAAAAAAAAPYPIIQTSTALLSGTFVMHGRITVAVGVSGEQPGQLITRTWVFTPQQCDKRTNSCAQVVVDRERSAGTHTPTTLRRDAAGTYRGAGSFDAPLRCLGRTYPHGETAFYAITLRIRRAVVIGGARLAQTITATYTNSRRVDHTICPLGPSHDAARYTGMIDLSAPLV